MNCDAVPAEAAPWMTCCYAGRDTCVRGCRECYRKHNCHGCIRHPVVSAWQGTASFHPYMQTCMQTWQCMARYPSCIPAPSLCVCVCVAAQAYGCMHVSACVLQHRRMDACICRQHMSTKSLTRAHEQEEGVAKAAAVRAMQAASGLYEFDYEMSKEHSDILPGAVRVAVNGKALEGEVCLN